MPSVPQDRERPGGGSSVPGEQRSLFRSAGPDGADAGWRRRTHAVPLDLWEVPKQAELRNTGARAPRGHKTKGKSEGTVKPGATEVLGTFRAHKAN